MIIMIPYALRKLAHAINRYYFSFKNLKYSAENLDIFSSPEPKAHRGAYRIGRRPASVRRRRRPSSVVHHFQRSSSLKPLGQSKPNFI